MRVRLIRENGGHGDVIRCLGVARSIKDVDPSIEVWFYVMAYFRTHPDLCPDVDVVVPLKKDERRPWGADIDPEKFAYLRSDLKFDASVNLCCPAWEYEVKNAPNIEKDRTQVWTEAAAKTTGLKLEPRVARINLPPNHRSDSRSILARIGLKTNGTGKPLVGLAPSGTHPFRCMTLDCVEGLCRLLVGSGMDVVILSGNRVRWNAIAQRQGCHSIVLPTTELIYGVVEALDLLIAIDSGPLHFAGVTGTRTIGVFGCTGGEALCRRYPSHSWIDPDASDRSNLRCEKPCYYLRFGKQQAECKELGSCVAMGRIEPDRIARRAIEAMADMSVRG